MRRRDFFTLLGAAATAWPLAAWAQQGEPVRRVGVLMGVAADGPEGPARLAAFLNGLQQLGWTDGRNVRIDYRWGAGDADLIRKYAAELVALGPNVILASGDHPVVALQQATRTVPIVFTTIADPVGAGVVESLARPGRNFTGFLLYEYGLTVKWLELLKEIAPGVKRVAVIREAGTAAGTGQFAAIHAAAPALGVELSPIAVQDFFRENGQTPSHEQSGKFDCCEAEGIRILCGDFFNLTKDDLAEVSAVYDRASLIALPPEMRERYARHLVSILPLAAQILLVTVDYPQAEMSGPPFAVSVSEVEALYR